MWELFRYTLEIGTEGRFTTYRLDKWEHINFPFVIFPFLCSNIPVSSTYEVYFSTLKLFDSFTDGSMHCLIVNEYLCHRWPRIYFICGSQIPFLILELVLSVFSFNYGFWLFSVFFLHKMASFITHVENNKMKTFFPKKILKMEVYL